MPISLTDAESLIDGIDEAVDVPPIQDVSPTGVMSEADAESNVDSVIKIGHIQGDLESEQIKEIEKPESDSKAVRIAKSFGGGLLTTATGTGEFLESIGTDSESIKPHLGITQSLVLQGAKKLSAKVGQAIDALTQPLEEKLAVEDPTFVEKLVSGAGSLASFAIPGFGVVKGSKIMGAAPKVAALIGTSVSAVIESATEAGAVYEDNIKQGMSEEDATKASSATFFTNLPVNFILDKWMFNKLKEGKVITETLKASGQEGAQEAIQQVISNVATGRDPLEGAAESAVIGGLLGGGATAIRSGIEQVAKGREIEIDQEAQKDLPTQAEVEARETRGSDEVLAPAKETVVVPSEMEVGGNRIADVQEETGQVKPLNEISPSKTIKLTQAEIGKISEVEGIDVAKAPSKKLKQTYEAAKVKGLDQQAEELAREVLTEGKILNDEEHSGMVIRAAQVETDIERTQAKIEAFAEEGLTDQVARENARLDSLLNSRDQILSAGSVSGTKVAQALNARKTAIDKEEFTLANVFSNAQKNKGESLSVGEKAKLAELTKQVKEHQATIKELQKQLVKKETKGVEDISELKELQKQIVREEVKVLQAKRSVREKVFGFKKPELTLKSVTIETGALSRAMKSTADMSGVLRQGAWLIARRPKAFAQSFGGAFKAFFSQNTADAIDIKMRKSEEQYMREKAGLYLSNIDSFKMSEREEAFASRLARNIPGFGKIVEASERHMVTFLNLMRASAFDSFANAYPSASNEELAAWAEYVNVASGRGNLGRFESAVNELGITFFAARYAVSRVQTPKRLLDNWSNKSVRNEIAKDMLAFVGVGAMTLTLAAMAGLDVGLDPEEADFGKIIVGNNRIDIWGGFQQPARVLITPILEGLDTAGVREANKNLNTIDAAIRFASYKLSPTITIPIELLRGKTIIGQETTPVETMAKAFVPLFIEGAVEIALDDTNWATMGGLSFFSWFGTSVQTHTPKEGKLKPVRGAKGKKPIEAVR